LGGDSENRLADQEIEHLRLQLWRSRGYYSRRLGGLMIISSGILLIIGYLTRYLTFEIASIMTLLVGAILFLYNLDPQIRIRPVSQTLLSIIRSFIDLREFLDSSGRGIFIPSEDGSVNLEIPIKVGENLREKSIKSNLKNNNSISIRSPGNGLYRLYVEELGELNEMELSYLFKWLPKTMVERLNLCEKVEFTVVNDTYHTVLTRPFLRDICRREDVKEPICYSIGCPLTSSIADSLAMFSGKKIQHVTCRYEHNQQISYLSHKICP